MVAFIIVFGIGLALYFGILWAWAGAWWEDYYRDGTNDLGL